MPQVDVKSIHCLRLYVGLQEPNECVYHALIYCVHLLLLPVCHSKMHLALLI